MHGILFRDSLAASLQHWHGYFVNVIFSSSYTSYFFEWMNQNYFTIVSSHKLCDLKKNHQKEEKIWATTWKPI